jgi:hypothetical protein
VNKKVNYLNNRDILREIHRSKASYCSFIDNRFSHCDIILDSIEEINDAALWRAKEARAARISLEDYRTACVGVPQEDRPKQKDFLVTADDISTDDIVFRVMTFDHVPEELERKKTHRREADRYARVNFPPFKHYAFIEGQLTEVGRSHWIGGIHNGEFSTDHGQITRRLADMFNELVKRISLKGKFRQYSYLDEMKSQALLQLIEMGLKFNEAKSDNPFSYYTATVINSFRRVLNQEKKQQKVVDDIRIESGLMPSFSRQLDHEFSAQALRDSATAESSEPTIGDYYDEKK